MQFLQARTYAPSAANRMHLRSRPAALSAKDFICLKTIHDAIEGVMKSCVAGIVTARNARYAIMKLALLRKRALLPQTIFCVVHRAPKNFSIATLEGGDDDIYGTYKVNRDQLQMLFDSLHAPPMLRLQGQHAGEVASEFGFILWLHYHGKGCTIASMQTEFGMEYSRLLKFIHAFEIYLFDEHSFRVTDSWHFWAPHVEEFNRHLRNMNPPPGYEQMWAVGIDASLVRDYEQFFDFI
jgi:hypothetical protein